MPAWIIVQTQLPVLVCLCTLLTRIHRQVPDLLVERDEGARLGWTSTARPPEFSPSWAPRTSLLWPPLTDFYDSTAVQQEIFRLCSTQNLFPDIIKKIFRKNHLWTAIKLISSVTSSCPALVGGRSGQPIRRDSASSTTELQLPRFQHFLLPSSAQLYEGDCTTRCI